MAGMRTIAIHAGDHHNDVRSHVMPIYQNSTYTYDSIEHGQQVWRGEENGYIYARLGNPNTEATARVIAALETHNLDVNGYALMTSSGMAAITLVMLGLVYAGDTVLAQHSLYGCTATMFRQHLPNYHIQTDFFDGFDLDDLERTIHHNHRIRLIFIETPANPTLALTDIAAVAERAHAVGALLVVDNTFATPILQQPFAFGADVIIHSTTKYLTGHGIVVGGSVVTTHQELYECHLKPAIITYGMNEAPMDAWLTYNGIKTLPLRMRQHCENARTIAQYLDEHPAIAQVYYPGLPNFPQQALADRQMNDYGGMISFELKGGYEAGVALMNNVNLYTRAVSLGTVDSLIQHPASMTHFNNPPEVRQAMGITDGLIRVSVGIEDVHDLITDLQQALAAIPALAV